MKWQWIVPITVVGVVSLTAFTVVANEPWLEESPPSIPVPSDPFKPPPTSEPAPAVDYRCEAAAASYGPGGWRISCVNDDADEVHFHFDGPLPPEADS